ncbi:hypothetical protein RCL1_007924 [Eukaryota sp. TZLM3-RCL]
MGEPNSDFDFSVYNDSALKRIVSSIRPSHYSFSRLSTASPLSHSAIPKPLSTRQLSHRSTKTIGMISQPVRPPTREEMITDRNAAERWSRHQTKVEKQQAAIEAAKIAAKEKKDAELQALLHTIIKEESSFITAIDEFLSADDNIKLERKRALWKDWNESVFAKIIERINLEVESHGHTLVQQKQILFDQFLKMVQKKGSLFLSDRTSEYDPLMWQSLKVQISDINDPLSRDFELVQDDPEQKNRVKLKPKPMIPVTQWATLSCVSKEVTTKKSSKANNSSIEFNQFS